MRYLTITLLAVLILIAFGCGINTSNMDTPPPVGAVIGSVNEISPAEALPKTQAAYAQFVDVRTPEEFAEGHAARTVNIPLDQIAANLDRLEKNEPVYLICKTGRRSKEAGDILTKNGFKWVFSVSGGTAAWQSAGLPIEVKAKAK